MKRLLLCLLLWASAASAQFMGPRTWQIPVPATNYSTLGSSPSTNLHDVLNWIDDNWPTFDSTSYLVLNPTQDSLRVLSAWLDSNWPDRASRLYLDTNGFVAISGSSSNMQAAFGSIDSNLVANATNAYPRSNPSNFVTSAEVFAQPMAVVYGNITVTQLFTAGESWQDLKLINATTSGPQGYVFVTNGMVHNHAGADSIRVPTSGWYLAIGQVAFFLYGPGDQYTATFDTWLVRDNSFTDGSGTWMPGSRSWSQALQTSNSFSSWFGVWHKVNSSALVYANTNNLFSFQGLCAGTAASTKVVYASMELRRVGP